MCDAMRESMGCAKPLENDTLLIFMYKFPVTYMLMQMFPDTTFISIMFNTDKLHESMRKRLAEPESGGI